MNSRASNGASDFVMSFPVYIVKIHKFSKFTVMILVTERHTASSLLTMYHCLESCCTMTIVFFSSVICYAIHMQRNPGMLIILPWERPVIPVDAFTQDSKFISASNP